MKKSPVLFIILFFLVASIAAILFNLLHKPGNTNMWSIVPGTAAIIYESPRGVAAWNDAFETDIWKALSKIDSFPSVQDYLLLIDSLAENPGSVDLLVKDRGFLLSVHATSSSKFDFVYYLDLKNSVRNKAFEAVFDKIKNNNQFSFSNRIFNDFEITEITYLPTNNKFTFSRYKNYWFGSYTPFLVEDIIRLLTEEEEGFYERNKSLYTLTKLNNVTGTLYINYNRLADLTSSFLNSRNTRSTNEIRLAGKNAFFDFNLNKNYLILNGFSYPDSMGMVNQFISQRPGKNTLSYFVPNNTASFFHYSISDPILWKSTFQNNKLSKEKNVDVSAFLKLTTGEFGMVNLENSVGFENEKLILAKIKNAEALVKFISELNQSASEPSDSLYAEQFTDYQINEIITKEFPSTVFNPDWTGFDRTYFSMVNDVLVMGNSIKTVKDFILDIENENTWGKSVRINNFLQNSIEESNLTLYFNVNRLWEDILVDLHPSWKEIFENNASTLRKFEIASIQFSGFEDKFYTNITLAFNNEKKILKPKNLFNVERKTILPADVVIKPKVVRNHTDRSLEVFVQDENNMIHLVDKRGTILWSEVIPEKITSSVTQIDYFKNGKLQYMFATENNIYLIDRNGNHVSPFPIQIQNYKIDKFSIIDYDKSKNYRLFLTDFSGNMYIYSKEGKLLDQWETAKNNGRQITPPTHIRIRGKDYILILQEKGAFSVLNRQGKLVNGFPYQFVKTPNPEYNIKEGNDLSNTLFTFVSNDGTLSEIYLNGKEKEVKQLYRISKDTRFKIVDETLGKGFVITQQEEGILKTLNPSGIELFSTKYLSPNPLNAQYYNFGSDRRLLVVNDIFQEYSYVFDFKGEMVNNSPFESSYEVGMVYFESSNSFNIYSAHENNVYIYSF